MQAVADKCHQESTVGWSHYIRTMVPGIDVMGGIVLNEFVGGINPEAVRAALQMGARLVWGPTLHGAYHISVFGRGTYERCIIATDSGQPFNPWPDEALRIFGQLLVDIGMDDETVRLMMVDNPARLLGLDSHTLVAA